MTSFMGDLAIPSTHSVAWEWDHRFDSLGDMTLVMECGPIFLSSSPPHVSTGYLEDVVVSKRRRLRKDDDESESEERRRGVAYPFSVVKPGGVEGDVTLSDINKRMLMRPRRAVRHPVGDWASRPRLSPEAPAAFSGKPVVALTTIQTHGNGTITIIRTKG